MKPRGIRNHNPGNIRRGQRWKGLADPEGMADWQKLETEFLVFKSPEWGIRAIARVLLTYRDKYKIRTVRGIVNRWAPPSENDSKAYAESVARALGVPIGARINATKYETMKALVKAIIRHENGVQPYSRAVIDKGLKMAGIEAPPRKKPPPVLKPTRPKITRPKPLHPAPLWPRVFLWLNAWLKKRSKT